MDTSAYSRFKRGESRVVDLLSSARWIGVPAIVLGELRTGFLLGSRPDRNEEELQQFLANPVTRVLDVEDDASSLYADIVVELRRAGRPVPTNDIWIAAIAAREGATVLTFDAHFQEIRRIGCLVL